MLLQEKTATVSRGPEAEPGTPCCKACHGPLNPVQSLGAKNGYALLPCTACGTVTVSPFPTVPELTAFYQAYEGSCDYGVKKDKKIARAARRIRRLTGLTAGKRFLDVGCNYGFTVKAALDQGLEAFGVDIDEVAVRASQEMFGPGHFGALSVQGYAAAGRKADIIYTSEVIEHVPDPDSFVAAIAAILTRGGVLYLTTPDGGHWSLPRDFSSWAAVCPPEHIIWFTRRGIKILLEKHGLRVERFFFSWKPGIRLIARKA